MEKDQRIPADMLVLKTHRENNQIFIRTDQLDGETDWKLRKAPELTQKLNSVFDTQGEINVEPPTTYIYNFRGLLSLNEETESLALEHTIWANTILASDHFIGIVIYTGKETRAQMNTSKPRTKVSILDIEVDIYNKILFVIMVLLSILIIFFKGLRGNFLTNLILIVRFIVLLCAILPISLRVNLEIAKTVNSYILNRNKHVKEIIVRNSQIPEELGRVELIFSDKTGTLTKNEMVCKKIAFEGGVKKDETDIPEMTEIIMKQCAEPELLTEHGSDSKDSLCLSPRSPTEKEEESSDIIKYKKRRSSVKTKKSLEKTLLESITALTLCNNVTPIEEESSESFQRDNLNPTEITYQASSPDELALVDFAKQIKMILFFRDDSVIKFKTPTGRVEEYEILANFPFTSERKRMGILVRNKSTHKIILYIKGSENVMMNLVSTNNEKAAIKEETDALANMGLRTLVITQKHLDEHNYSIWSEEFKKAKESMMGREEKVEEMIKQLENNLELLCVTGIEDKLQDEVEETITALQSAGIGIWMLTGDKIETATCIAKNAGIRGKDHKELTIRSGTGEIINEEYINKMFESFKVENPRKSVLVIDGECLEVALTYCEKQFFLTSLQMASVVCCRCSPTQKAKIVKNIKKYTQKRTLSIGDGGNDVAMIQEADCGVGIVGKEGKHASLAADFSVNNFKDLNVLLLYYGRNIYKNTAMVAHFIIHRGMIIAFMQYIFSVMFYFFPIPLYNGFLTMGYTSFYTNIPVVTMLLDRDLDIEKVFKFPELYRHMTKARELSFKAFLSWVFISIFQAGFIMLGSVLLFKGHFHLQIVTISFTCLVMAELLNIYSEVN
jgi:phospholipid-translocating ATPase